MDRVAALWCHLILHERAVIDAHFLDFLLQLHDLSLQIAHLLLVAYFLSHEVVPLRGISNEVLVRASLFGARSSAIPL